MNFIRSGPGTNAMTALSVSLGLTHCHSIKEETFAISRDL